MSAEHDGAVALLPSAAVSMEFSPPTSSAAAVGSKRRAHTEWDDALADSSKRAMLVSHSSSPPAAASSQPMDHERILFHHASLSPHPAPVSSSGLDFVPVLGSDAKCFQEATTFAKKHHITPNNTPAAQAAALATAAFEPLQMPPASALDESLARMAAQPVAPSMQLAGVQLVAFALPAPPAPAAVPFRPRPKLQCPPTPAPRMCLGTEESSAVLFGNRLLMQRAEAADADDDTESLLSGADDELDIPASPAFVATRTYTSSNPFAHTLQRNGGSFIFEREFRSHKCIGHGNFFDVFRCEAIAEPTAQSTTHPLARSGIVAPIARSSVAAATASSSSSSSSSSSRRRVFAIKKSLRPFQSLYDRSCLLRETSILALLQTTLLTPPAASPLCRSPIASIPAHRNKHLIRWHRTWQESGCFFEQLQYCSLSLAEYVFVLLQTAPDATSSGPLTASSSAQSQFHLSYFHQHLPRLFLSLLTQMSLALHTLHHVVPGVVVHLDVKPDNFLISRGGTRVVLSDFGLARRMSEFTPQQRTRTTTDGSVREVPSHLVLSDELEGDCCYAAGELLAGVVLDEADKLLSSPQENGIGVSPHADMFSLGMLLFEMVSNSQLPKSGYLWQRLRQGHVEEYLPSFESAAPAEPVGSQAHLGAAVYSNEQQQDGVTAWMVSLIANLLSPKPSARMSSAEVLVAIEEKLLSLGWIAPDPAARPLDTQAAVDARASLLAFEWSAALPPCLALPPMASLNLGALIDRARELSMAPLPATPTGLISPQPLGNFGQAAGARMDSPCLARQRSSPSPSRHGGFFNQQPLQLQPRVSPFPITPSSSSGLPPSPWSLHLQARASLAATAAASTTPRIRVPHIHARSSSLGMLSVTDLHSPRDGTRDTPGTDSPTFVLTATDSYTTPNMQRLQRTLAPRPPPPEPTVPELVAWPSAAPASSHAPLPVIAEQKTSPPLCRPAERKPAAAVAIAERPRIVVPEFSHRSHLQPLSPLKLNSPARKQGTNATQTLMSRPAVVSASGVLPLHPGVPTPMIAAPGSAAMLANSTSSASISSNSSSAPQGLFGGIPQHRALFGAGAASPSSEASSVPLCPPPPVPRAFGSASILSCLASASAPSPPASPAIERGASSTGSSMFGLSAAHSLPGNSAAGFTAGLSLGSMFGSRAPKSSISTTVFNAPVLSTQESGFTG